jgi:DNA-binding CsgD family transcriptional regulator
MSHDSNDHVTPLDRGRGTVSHPHPPWIPDAGIGHERRAAQGAQPLSAASHEAASRLHPAPPQPALPGDLLASALDEIDLGIALVDAAGRVLHSNHRARRRLGGVGPLSCEGSALRCADARSQQRLQAALLDATRHGRRRLVVCGTGAMREIAALVPVRDGVAALLLGRTDVVEELSLHFFASSHDLTPAETRVLQAIGRGIAPTEIARGQGVKISTVRTQIKAIRQKTGVSTITGLVRLVAGLPPMLGVLRG